MTHAQHDKVRRPASCGPVAKMSSGRSTIAWRTPAGQTVLRAAVISTEAVAEGEAWRNVSRTLDSGAEYHLPPLR